MCVLVRVAPEEAADERLDARGVCVDGWTQDLVQVACDLCVQLVMYLCAENDVPQLVVRAVEFWERCLQVFQRRVEHGAPACGAEIAGLFARLGEDLEFDVDAFCKVEEVASAGVEFAFLVPFAALVLVFDSSFREDGVGHDEAGHSVDAFERVPKGVGFVFPPVPPGGLLVEDDELSVVEWECGARTLRSCVQKGLEVELHGGTEVDQEECFVWVALEGEPAALWEFARGARECAGEACLEVLCEARDGGAVFKVFQDVAVFALEGVPVAFDGGFKGGVFELYVLDVECTYGDFSAVAEVVCVIDVVESRLVGAKEEGGHRCVRVRGDMHTTCKKKTYEIKFITLFTSVCNV